MAIKPGDFHPTDNPFGNPEERPVFSAIFVPFDPSKPDESSLWCSVETYADGTVETGRPIHSTHDEAVRRAEVGWVNRQAGLRWMITSGRRPFPLTEEKEL